MQACCTLPASFLTVVERRYWRWPRLTLCWLCLLLPLPVQVWSLGNPTPNMTLEGHEKGVNCVDYYSGACCVLLCSVCCFAESAGIKLMPLGCAGRAAALQ